jgi:hypothetical protein
MKCENVNDLCQRYPFLQREVISDIFLNDPQFEA